MKKLLLTICVFNLFLTTSTFGQSRTDREIEGVTSIAGPTITNEQLAPLFHPLFKDTKILGIGENVHGSSQILQMQNRLVQYAVEKEGIRLIFWEIRDAESLNQYLRTGEGDIVRILKNIRFWAIQEEIDLFQWLQQFNAKHPHDQVRVRGVDIYNFGTIEHQWLFKKLAQTSILNEVTNLLGQTAGKCIGHNKDHDEYMVEIFAYYENTAVISRPAITECFAILDQVQSLIQNADAELKNRIGSIGVAEVSVYVRNLKALQRHFLSRFTYGDSSNNWLWRDSAMAQNVLDFWNGYQKPKSIFLAHTSHVAKQPASYEKNTDPFVPAGVYLSQTMGKKYKTIGFTGYDIDGVQGDFIVPTAKDSLDNVLHKLGGFDFAWIDTTNEKFNRLWWVQNENGGENCFPDGVNLNPSTNYDAMVFVYRSEASETIDPYASEKESEAESIIRTPQIPDEAFIEPKKED